MIDFRNGNQTFKMKEVSTGKFDSTARSIYIDGEESVACYQAERDYIIFTNKRMIVVNVQGFFGSKKDFSCFPYKTVQAFSARTAGLLDTDIDVELVFAISGTVHLEFTTSTDVGRLLKLIGENVL